MVKTTEIKNVLNQMTDDVQSNVKRLINLFSKDRSGIKQISGELSLTPGQQV